MTKQRKLENNEDYPENNPIEGGGKATGMYQELFDLSPSPAAVFSTQGHCQLVNRAFSYQLGYERGSLLRGEVLFQDIFRKKSVAEELVAELKERHVIRRREVYLKDNEGRVIPMLFSGRTITFDDQPCFDVSLTDISHQKRLERAFRRDHARMVSLIDSLTAGLFLVDNDGLITEFNTALFNLLGAHQVSMTRKPYHELFMGFLSGALEPEVIQQSLSRAVMVVSERPVVEIAYDEDNPKHLEVAFFPVWDEEGAVLGWGGLVQDVTDIRDRLAWKLELLSILAHDIRTPLATLKGHATALLANYRRWGDEMVVEFLEAMDRTSDDLVRQVDRSLALTRVEAGRMGLRPEAIEPIVLIRQSIERAAGVLDDIPLELDVPENLPKIRADPARVEEVLVNLLDNAARYSPSENPIIIRANRDGPLLQLSITNHGPDIQPDRHRMIFDKYTRADSEGGGVGLGLFIARRIVEAHGGKIWVTSPPPNIRHGAQFTFTLPVMPDQPTWEPTQRTEAPTMHEGLVEGQSILVVEDEPDTQALLHTILTQEGYEVIIAPDGPVGLELFKTSTPELVLLDWMLPGLNGLLVCRAIRRWSDVPILIITSRTSQDDLVTALDAGADDYVTKPFQSTELLARMKALLRRGRGWEEAEERDRFSAEGLLIDFDAHDVWQRGKHLELTPTEFKLLTYLVHHQGQVLTYDQLVDHLWGLETGRTRHDLFVHISRLRKKIEPKPKEPRFIVTRWGIGYVFMPK
ncbi:MAG: response regulator [Anaerolineaceae bacterium]|nr:MAG: response regulator [Anaerolineaceae bacterium]